MLAWKQSVAERFVHDRRARCRRILAREGAALAHRHAENGEERAADRRAFDDDRVAAGGIGRCALARPERRERHAGRRGCRSDARQAAHDVDNLRGRHAAGVLDTRAQQRRGPKSKPRGACPLKALDHARGHDEQRDGDRDFEHDECVTPALPDPIRRADRAQRVGMEAPCFVQRRRNAGHDAGEDGDQRRLQEHTRIDREIEEADVDAAAIDQHAAQCEGDAHAECAAGSGEQQRLGQQCAHDAAAARSERCTDRNLVLT